jgi:hypothetical protein
MSKSKPSKNSTKRNVVLPEGPKLFALIVFTVVGIIAYITFINYLQSGSLSRSSEASEKLCPISGSHSNGCFIINRCNRDGFGTGESSCYRYINYSCQNGKYAGKNQYLNPLSKCWSEEQALSRISELCGCGGELENKIISCNQTLEYNGNQGITTVQMDLGKGTGMVGLTFNAYGKVSNLVKKTRSTSEKFLEKFIKNIKKTLALNGIVDFKTDYRVKGLYSLYKKLGRKGR